MVFMKLSFSNSVKAKAYPKQDIFNLINLLDKDKYHIERIYLAITFSLANRSGELLPYQHYTTTYERDSEGRLIIVKGEKSNYAKIKSRIPSGVSNGIDVSDIEFRYDSNNEVDLIIFNKIPVFKAKVITYDSGMIYRKSTPFFDEILKYIVERKALPIDKVNRVWLFPKPENVTHEHYFWSFKKRVQTAIKKVLPAGMSGFVLHSLRTSRATDSAEISKGDVFYVKGVTRHRSIKNLEQYVQKVNMEKKTREYEGGYK
jgi:hypothetical protein